MGSPFLSLPASRHVASNALAFAIEDGFPVSPGHTLVIPRREVRTWFDATPAEQAAIFALVDEVKRLLDARLPKPDGYNVGFNAGEAAGQTVMHLHVHVIPRYRGDMDDPRGGVRHVIPSKGNYLASTAPAHTDDASFIETLLTLLDQAQLTSTYKLAVLLALVDLCLERATESGAAPSSVTTRQLAEKVLALYWPQTAPFGETAAVLRQNAGSERGARVLRRIEEFRVRAAGDPTVPLARARATAPTAFEVLVRDVEWTMILMPLPRVQVLPGGQEHRFLYDIAWSVQNPLSPSAFRHNDFDNVIRFKPGAAERLVSMAGVIRPAVQRRWALKVARLNDALVPDARLEDFLFGASRSSLTAVRGPLVELHAGRCFYCDHRLAREVEVDHFIAWSRHPENAVENLVPSHAGCNASKRDHLASAAHVARFTARLRESADDLARIGQRAQWEQDAGRVLAVARGIYLRLRPEVRLWHARDDFQVADLDRLRRALAG
jgi:diadenosine tetraphosphate (Ap4A) HIT family hydrolase/5-methylcytosine-specific restriction endonuclease McrA